MEFFDTHHSLDLCEVVIQWRTGYMEEDFPVAEVATVIDYLTGSEQILENEEQIQMFLGKNTWDNVLQEAIEYKYSGDMRLATLGFSD